MIPLVQLKTNTYKKLLPVYGNRESRALIRVLQEDLLDAPKNMLDGDDLVMWNQAVQRLLLHEPVAYITGKAYFLNLELKVNRRVLIPRPETETLVIEAIQQLKNYKRPKVLDIGTGSGCIALAIRASNSEYRVYGLDVDGLVLNVALENALNHNLDIEWLQSDILDQETWKDLPFELDFIISNPPYILEGEKKFMSASTLHYEPPLSLFAGTDPVQFYKAIAGFGLKHLKARGRIMVEINEFLSQETMAVFDVSGYSKPELIKDLSGKDRIISVVKI